MKRFYTPSPVFTPSSATLDFTALAGFDVRRLAAVLDLKTGVMIYGPLAGFGFSAISGSVLTLQASMAGLSASDPLLTIYDDSTGKVAEDASVQAVAAAIQTLIADLQNNHADLGTIHADLSATLHQDLQSILSKLGGSPAQSSDVAAVVAKLGAAPAQSADVQAVKTTLGTPAQTADVQAIGTKLGTPAQSSDVQAVVTKLGAGPAQSADVQAVVTKLGTAPAQTADVAAVKATLGTPAQSADVQAVTAKLGTSPAQSADVAAIVTKLNNPAQSSDVAAVKSALGAAPAQTADIQALGVLVQAMLTAIQNQRTESLWTDNSGAYYVRIDIPGASAPTWTTYTGAASAAPGAGARPAAGTDFITESDTYRAVNTASGSSPAYNAGDLLKHIETFNPNTGASVGQFWANITQNTTPAASAITGTDLQLLDPLAEGAATLAAQLAGNASLATAVSTLASILTATSTNHADLVTLHTDLNGTLNADLQAILAGIGTPSDAATLTSQIGLLKKLVSIFSAALTVSGTVTANIASATGSGLALDASTQSLIALVGTKGDTASAGSALGLLAGLKSDLDTGLGNDTTALAAIAPTQTWQANLLAAVQALQSLLGVATASGTLASSGANVALSSGPYGTASFEIPTSSTWVGTIQAFGKIGSAGGFDVPLMIRNLDASVTNFAPTLSLVSTAAANLTGRFFVEDEGMQGVEILMSTWTSGSAAVSLCATSTVRSTHIKAPANDPAYVALAMIPAGGSVPAAVSAANAVPMTGTVTPAAGTTWQMSGQATVTPAASTTWSVAPATAGTLFAMAGIGSISDPAVANAAEAAASLTLQGRIRVDTPNYGVGVSAPLPALANAYGTPIGTPPTPCKGISIFVPPGASVTYSIQALGTTYTAGSPLASTLQNVFSNPTAMPMWLDEEFNGASLNLFLAAVTNGSAASGNTAPTFRWK